MGAAGKVVMKELIFFYGIFFILACMLAVCVCVCAFLVSHRRVHLASASFFFFDLFESALVMLDEYLGEKTLIDFSARVFPMTHMHIKLVLSIGLIASFWFVILYVTDQKVSKRSIVPIVVFAFAQAFSLLVPGDNLRQFIFYGLRSVFMLGSLGFVAFTYVRTKDEGLKSYLCHFKKMTIALILLILLVLFEDACHLVLPYDYCHFFLSASVRDGLDYVYFSAGRNMAENVMTLLLMVYAVRSCAQVLSLRFNEPPTTESSRAKQLAEVQFARFCEECTISERERDVLGKMLEGKANRQIAEELFISVGTVKAHVHAIYRKCGVASRDELLQRFWEQ